MVRRGPRFESGRGLWKSPAKRDFLFGSACAFNYLLRVWSFHVKRLAHVIMSE
jgi:hypothetical protein